MYWFLFCKDEILLTAEGFVPQGKKPPLVIEPWHTQIHLPELRGEACRAVRLDGPFVRDGFQMAGLRASFDILNADDYAMAGKAHELLYWDATTKHCGVCGAPMKFHTDISKRCTNCGKEVWPSLTTAIIVAVTRGDDILLVQSKNFRGDYLGLVAGFVETGETLEACVHREVWEETHIKIKNLRYFASQPWPYPSGLMVGFTAEYDSGEISLQRSELTKGGWYSLGALPAIPGKVSLARQLIDHEVESRKKEASKE